MSQKPNDPEQDLENSSDVPGDESGQSVDESEVPVAVEAGESEADDLAELPAGKLIELLAEAREEIDGMKDGYIRARAEVENVRRRSQNEIVSARKYAIEGFAQELLSVVDSLDQAAKVDMSASNDEAVEKMKEGLDLTLKQFDKVMEKFGVSAVQAEPGVKFDPEVHQAISVVPSDEVESECIVHVMQKGFLLKGRLLRPAMVSIAKSAENP